MPANGGGHRPHRVYFVIAVSDAHPATLVSHVLLLETDAGLVLVDTGVGLGDVAGPARRLGWFRYVIRPVFSSGWPGSGAWHAGAFFSRRMVPGPGPGR